jgi:hypothetical protein
MVLVLDDEEPIGPTCETQRAAVAITPMGIDDANAIYANLRSRCGAFLPDRALPPPGPPPQAKNAEPELHFASVPPVAVLAVAAVGGAALYWLLLR